MNEKVTIVIAKEEATLLLDVLANAWKDATIMQGKLPDTIAAVHHFRANAIESVINQIIWPN